VNPFLSYLLLMMWTTILGPIAVIYLLISYGVFGLILFIGSVVVLLLMAEKIQPKLKR